METSFAITGKGYVIVAADTTAARSIVKMKVDEDKIKTLSPHLLMAYSGEPGRSTSTCALSFHPCKVLQAILSNLRNTWNGIFAYTKFVTCTLSVRQPLLRGYAGRWRNLCGHVNPTLSIS
jgi:hypothetical protein